MTKASGGEDLVVVWLESPELSVGRITSSVSCHGLGCFPSAGGTVDASGTRLEAKASEPVSVSHRDVSRCGVRSVAWTTALAICALVRVSGAEVTSDFTSGADGWTVSSGGSLTWVAAGGNPSGHIQLTDVATGLYTLDAPSQFLGDLTAFDGGTFSLELSLVFDNGGSDVAQAGELSFAGPGGTATLDVFCTSLDSGWTKVSVALSADVFGISQSSWKAILADVTVISFVPDFLNFTGDVAGVDNVVLAEPVSGCATIDFEDAVPVGCGFDDLPITTRYQPQCGVVFGIDSDGNGFIDGTETPRLEASGGAGDGPFAFNNNELGDLKDTADPGLEPRLGSYLLRGQVPLAPVTLIVLYDQPVAAASGEIWDIDFGAAEGTEQWLVEALGFDYATGLDPDDVVETELSPVGVDLTLDGRPWTFSFDRSSADIYALRLVHVGTDTTGVGLAFDNFSPSSPAPSVPALGSRGKVVLFTGLLLAGAAALHGSSRRSRPQPAPGPSAQKNSL